MKHDHPGRRCANCAFWQRSGARLASAQRDPSSSTDVGTCQLHAPQLFPTQHFAASMYPQTHESRFCGEWVGAAWSGGPDGGESVVAFPTANQLAA